MFNNTQRNFNNNGNSVNVNTRLVTSYSDTAMIVFGAWNQQYSLKIHPLKGISEDGTRQYAQDSGEVVSTSISMDNAQILKEAIEKEFEPALSAGKECTIGIMISSGDAKKSLSLKTDGTDVFLVIAIGVSEEGSADPNNILVHKFNKRQYVLGYDPQTGAGETKEANSDYYKFAALIKNVDNLFPLTAHSIEYQTKTKQSYAGRNSGNYGGGQQTGYQAPTTNFNGGEMSFLPNA